MVVTFDFDNTIAMSSMDIVDDEVIYTFEGYNNDIVDKIRDHIRLGDDVFIVTSRVKTKEDLFPEDTIPKHLEKLGLHGYFLPNRLYYTDGQPKLQVLRQIGTELHWDDDVEEMISLKNAGIPYESPLDFYDDCNEVAKIMIFDRDDKMLILERGDAGKLWDLPGGHLKGFECDRGEHGYSTGLEREVAEETGLMLPFEKKIGSFVFQWKGQSQNIHIYISKVNESMPKVNLHLQKLQENDSYEWVDVEELEEFLKHSTTVLRKGVEMLPEGELFEQNEPIQRKWAKDYRAKKAKLLDKGPNKDTGGGEGFEKTDLERAKSAPPPFGGSLEESMDQLLSEIEFDVSKLSVKDHLNPSIWKNDSLIDTIRLKLLRIANDFAKNSPIEGVVENITFTGSLAGYNYHKGSDIDLHLLVDFKESDETLKDLMNQIRINWNNNHDIRINGHEVEIYVQDLNEKHYSAGVYSISNDKWIVKPEKIIVDLDYDAIIDKAKGISDEIDAIGDVHDIGEYQKVQKSVVRLKEKMKKMRSSGLEKDGIYSIENLAFKLLRNSGQMDRLMDLGNNSYDKVMSIGKKNKIKVNIVQNIDEKKKKKKKKKKKRSQARRVGSYWPYGGHYDTDSGGDSGGDGGGGGE